MHIILLQSHCVARFWVILYNNAILFLSATYFLEFEWVIFCIFDLNSWYLFISTCVFKGKTGPYNHYRCASPIYYKKCGQDLCIVRWRNKRNRRPWWAYGKKRTVLQISFITSKSLIFCWTFSIFIVILYFYIKKRNIYV